MIKRYKKKPIIIEAVQWTSDNKKEIESFINNVGIITSIMNSLYINTVEGLIRVDVGDYIIKGLHGEFYSCKPEIFKQSYEEVNEA